MSEIVKICKIHGQLTKDQVYKVKNKRNKYDINCKICRKKSMNKYDKKRKEFVTNNRVKCRLSDCDRNVTLAKTTLCTTHLGRWQKYKSFNLPIPPDLPEGIVRICEIHGELDESKIRPTYSSRNKAKDCLPFPYTDSECRQCVADRMKKHRLKKNYGLSKEDYHNLFSKQNGKCAICNQEESYSQRKGKRKRKLGVDHCHKTGKVRGLLCSHCNAGLGMYKDSIEIHLNAIEYLRRNKFDAD